METAGVGLLLDLSHARCTAYHAQTDIYRYLTALPLDGVREIHTNGPRLQKRTGLTDLHYSMQEVDYQLLDWVLKRTTASIVTLEYGGTGSKYETPERNDKDALRAQLQRLHQLRTQQPIQTISK